MAIERGVPWSLPIFAIGFGLVFTLTRVNRRYRHSSPTLRRTIDVSGSFMDLSLLAGILVVANVLAFRYGGRPLDLTREGAYSLTPETVTQVQALDQPVSFTLISGADAIAELKKVRVKQLLESYRSINPRLIHIAELNPFVDATRFDELTKRVPELLLLRGGGVLIEYGEDKATPPILVRNQELFEHAVRPTSRGRPLQHALHGRGRDHIGVAAAPRGKDREGGVHHRARRAEARRRGAHGAGQLEGPAGAGGLPGG